MAYTVPGDAWDNRSQYKKAFDVYAEGANKGEAECFARLGFCYENGYVKIDIQKAIECYAKASDLGVAAEARSLGDVQIAKKIGFIYLQRRTERRSRRRRNGNESRRIHETHDQTVYGGNEYGRLFRGVADKKEFGCVDVSYIEELTKKDYDKSSEYIAFSAVVGGTKKIGSKRGKLLLKICRYE